MMKMNGLSELLQLLALFKKHKIYHKIENVRDEAIMIEIVVPGERWEVEFLEDGSIEVEIFHSDGKMFGREKITALLKQYEH